MPPAKRIASACILYAKNRCCKKVPINGILYKNVSSAFRPLPDRVWRHIMRLMSPISAPTKPIHGLLMPWLILRKKEVIGGISFPSETNISINRGIITIKIKSTTPTKNSMVIAGSNSAVRIRR